MKIMVLCVLCTAVVTATITFALTKNESSFNYHSSSTSGINFDSISEFLKKEQLVMFNKWTAKDDTNVYCIVRSVSKSLGNYNEDVKVSIFEENGSQIYEERFDAVQNIFSSFVLRKENSQLVIFAIQNGATVVKILDYRNAKVINLTDSIKIDDFGFIAEIRPQFQTGVNPAFEPYQILLTSGVGLASPVEKYTKVFRHKDGMYNYIGEFPTTKMDDCVEKLIIKPKER